MEGGYNPVPYNYGTPPKEGGCNPVPYNQGAPPREGGLIPTAPLLPGPSCCPSLSYGGDPPSYGGYNKLLIVC